MPIYEYECSNCHHTFDLMQKMNDEPAKQCPKCLGETAQRLVSAAGFQLKGTGWYATDFKDKGKPKPTSDVKSSSGDSKPDTSSKKKGDSD
jgi:putative FmdB family regulatory protein